MSGFRSTHRVGIPPIASCWPTFGRKLALVALCLLAAGASSGPQAAEEESLAGRLLVAKPSMPDPRFAHTVIYMVAHDKQGAMGLIVNRPVGHIPFDALLEGLDQPAEELEGDVTVHFGGPVAPSSGFVLHSPEFVLEGSRVVDDKLAFTTNTNILTAMAEGRGPEKALLAFGYSGWGPGQLETEMNRDDWFTIPFDISLVFTDEPAQIWKRAMAREEIEL
ncbi:MAG: YqgE/AlgH family protein [Alphaproteobacteria bacterium]